MVPHASAVQEAAALSMEDSVELRDLNIGASGLASCDYASAKMLTDPSNESMAARGDQSTGPECATSTTFNGSVWDGSVSLNGHVMMATSLSTEGSRMESDKSDDEEDDGLTGTGSVDRQPLLSGGNDEEETEEGAQEEMMEEEEKETYLSILLQVLVPYLIAGFGMVGAGMVLDVVQVWWFFSFLCFFVVVCMDWWVRKWNWIM